MGGVLAKEESWHCGDPQRLVLHLPQLSSPTSCLGMLLGAVCNLWGCSKGFLRRGWHRIQHGEGPPFHGKDTGLEGKKKFKRS